ncbi:MAG: sn-glycerol-3-phosphate ABC transporter ATP-binding protein UgpC [Eubacteriales bacterium]|nr:sn-glycerol-3-phosphate ABC transporter ATP-binding protein UgpC [Eubacteriales bacterium]
MSSITLKNIEKTYPGNVKVIEDLNLEIRDKEFIILVGPSGCGKSTTLRMIAGLEEVTGGELCIGERRVNDVPPKDRDIAMVFQNYALYPHMTVYKNMAFALSLRKEDKRVIDQKVREAAKILDIEHLLNRKPKALSGGQRQRVALGRAMVRDPAVFLLDEPLSNLDAKLRTQMRTEITKLHKRLETTFVYVTHDQTEAMTMGDRIVVMKDGEIQQVDTPQNLYDSPCNLFVAGFIGSPQMNFIDAVLVQRDGAYRVEFGPYSIPLHEGMAERADLAAYEGRPVVLGVRPEDLHTEPAFLDASQESAIELKVDLAELMGAEIYLYGETAGAPLTVRAPSRVRARAGDAVRLAVDRNKMHLFDKETERVISNG